MGVGGPGEGPGGPGVKTRKNQKNVPERMARLLRSYIQDFVQQVPVQQMALGARAPPPFRRFVVNSVQHATQGSADIDQIGFLYRGYRYTYVEVDADIDVNRDVDICLFKGVSKSVQERFNGIEAVMVLTLIILKQRAPVLAALQSPWASVGGQHRILDTLVVRLVCCLHAAVVVSRAFCFENVLHDAVPNCVRSKVRQILEN